ncbi:hypothetical protein JVT61DRAFT_734 [Boletus reticuloceps]|uniref:G domain-containing protein n=1 Tax=Boletus reticuloceps TaxID=495285 RepID=A0A8I2Z387_9AGAM|nr:hypothetical protein JVT61DRAFT_734 [Boletus reticuloceps]
MWKVSNVAAHYALIKWQFNPFYQLLSGRKSKGNEREKPGKAHPANNRGPSQDPEETFAFQGPSQVSQKLPAITHPPTQTNGGQQFKRDTKHTETSQGLPRASVKHHISVDSLHTRTEQQSQKVPHRPTIQESPQVSEELFAITHPPTQTDGGQQFQADTKHTETGQGLPQASGKIVTVDPLHTRSERAPRCSTIEGSPQTDTNHTATVQGVPQASGKPSVKVNTPLHPPTEQKSQIDGARPQAIQGSPQADTEHTEAAQGLLQASDKPSVTVDSSLHTGTGGKSHTDKEHPQASRGSPQSQTNTEYIETTPGPHVSEEPFAMVDTKNLETSCHEPTWGPQICEEPVMVNTEDLGPDDIVIAIMGPTGTGKSTLVRLASGYDIRIGHELKSCTKDILAIRFRDRESGRHIVLVDTPGFDDTYNSDLEILNLISDWLNSSYKKDKLLSGILYLHRISDNRMAGTPLKNLRVFQKLCGNDALDKVYLTTTMWDEVVLSEGERRLEELEAEYWKALIQQGAQVVCCRNDNDSAKEIIQRIVTQEQDATRKAVLLQQEMADST